MMIKVNDPFVRERFQQKPVLQHVPEHNITRFDRVHCCAGAMELHDRQNWMRIPVLLLRCTVFIFSVSIFSVRIFSLLEPFRRANGSYQKSNNGDQTSPRTDTASVVLKHITTVQVRQRRPTAPVCEIRGCHRDVYVILYYCALPYDSHIVIIEHALQRVNNIRSKDGFPTRRDEKIKRKSRTKSKTRMQSA